jgi:hypothetical protein
VAVNNSSEQPGHLAVAVKSEGPQDDAVFHRAGLGVERRSRGPDELVGATGRGRSNPMVLRQMEVAEIEFRCSSAAMKRKIVPNLKMRGI